MILKNKTAVNLSSNLYDKLSGHISIYELPSGNLYYVYFVEDKFYAAKEVCCKTNRVVEEEASDNEYHYSIDIFFNDPDRYTGWSCPSQGTHCSD